MNEIELASAIEAAYRAGEAIMKVYESADFAVEYKTDDSPLTLADRKAHAVIVSALEPIGLPILSEEGRQMPYAQRKGWRRFWMVDPLDGTKEFIKRNGEFTVNIAIIEHEAPVLGVIYVPVQDRMFFAVKDRGSFRIEAFTSIHDHLQIVNGMVGTTASLLLEQATRLPDARHSRTSYTVVGSRSHASPELEAYVTTLRQTHADMQFVAAGSSLKFCLVAEGKADHYPRLGPTMEWDTAAGQAIAECAGARVLDHDTRQPLRYNKPSLKNPAFLVIGDNEH